MAYSRAVEGLEMTGEQMVHCLLRAPWTVTAEPAEEGEAIVLRILELPAFIVVGRPPEVEKEFWLALESLLDSYAEAGEEPPIPESFRSHFEAKKRSSGMHAGIFVQGSAAVSRSQGSTWPTQPKLVLA
jgi:hypothetical protein